MAYQNDLRGRLIDAATQYPSLKAKILLDFSLSPDSCINKGHKIKEYAFNGEVILLTSELGDFDTANMVFETLARLFDPNDLGISHKKQPSAVFRLLMAIIRQEESKLAGYRWPDGADKIITITNIFLAAVELLPGQYPVKLTKKDAGPKIAEIFASDNTKDWSAQAVSDELKRRGYIYGRTAVGKHETFKKYRPHNG